MRPWFLLPLLCLLISCEKSLGPEPPKNADGSLTAAGVVWKAETGLAAGSDWVPGTVTFTDTVTAVHVSSKGQLYLNFGGEHPNQVLSVWMPKSYVRAGVPDFFLRLKGKLTTVTGDFRHYKGKPEIVVHKAEQITWAP